MFSIIFWAGTHSAQLQGTLGPFRTTHPSQVTHLPWHGERLCV